MPCRFRALYGSGRSLQVGVPKCDERRENRRLLPENSQQPDAEPPRRTSERGLLRESEPERVRDRRRGFVVWGCARGTVCGACVRAPGKPNSHRLLAELRLTGLACGASGGSVLVSTWTLTGRGNRESSRAPADRPPRLVPSPCGVFLGVYLAGKLVASADRSPVRPCSDYFSASPANVCFRPGLSPGCPPPLPV